MLLDATAIVHTAASPTFYLLLTGIKYRSREACASFTLDIGGIISDVSCTAFNCHLRKDADLREAGQRFTKLLVGVDGLFYEKVRLESTGDCNRN